MKNLENKVDVIANELKELNKSVGQVMSTGLVIGAIYVASNIQGCINGGIDQLADYNYRPDKTITLTYVDTDNDGEYDHLRQGEDLFALGGIKDDPIEFSKEKIQRDLHEPPYQVVEFENYHEYVKRGD